MSRNGSLQTIAMLAARPEGLATNEPVCGMTSRQVQNNACHMIADGRLIAVGRHPVRRVFVRPEDATRYELEVMPGLMARHKEAKRAQKAEAERQRKRAKKPQKKAVVANVTIKHYGRTPWDKDTPVDYSKAKFTVCPSPQEFGPMAKLKGIGA